VEKDRWPQDEEGGGGAPQAQPQVRAGPEAFPAPGDGGLGPVDEDGERFRELAVVHGVGRRGVVVGVVAAVAPLRAVAQAHRQAPAQGEGGAQGRPQPGREARQGRVGPEEDGYVAAHVGERAEGDVVGQDVVPQELDAHRPQDRVRRVAGVVEDDVEQAAVQVDPQDHAEGDEARHPEAVGPRAVDHGTRGGGGQRVRHPGPAGFVHPPVGGDRGHGLVVQVPGLQAASARQDVRAHPLVQDFVGVLPAHFVQRHTGFVL